MFKLKYNNCLAYLLCGLFITLTVNINAQSNNEKAENLSLKDRFAFRTNIMYWALATPNIGIQFDITPYDYNRWTLQTDLKWNPGVNNGKEKALSYQILDAKLELRKYFRNRTVKQRKSSNPKYWKAYYWGIYAGYTDYEIFLKNGFTGEHFGAGLSGGWEVPLYKFNTGALDLDLGMSAGWIYGKSKKRIDNGNEYIFTKVKDMHFTPYPIISEVRVALVYRFKSVKEKYNKTKR